MFDLGAGFGARTAPLAAAGARVVAVERHIGYPQSLTRRFAGEPGVRVVRRLPRACFTPPPRVDAALVTLSPYPMSVKMERRLAELLAAADHHPGRAVRKVVPGGPAALRAAGIDPAQPAATVPPECWRALVMR